jgi:hypothetical protein
LRRNPRYTLKCPATLTPATRQDGGEDITILEISASGFKARAAAPLPETKRWIVTAELAPSVRSRVQAELVRRIPSERGQEFGFSVAEPDDAWKRCLAWLEAA